MRFRRYALERIVAAVAAMILALVAVYLMLHVAGLPFPQQTEPGARALRAHFMDESFGDFLWRIIGHASLGRSFFVDLDAATVSFEAVAVTLSLVAWALVLGLALAIPFALLWRRWPRWTLGLPRAPIYLAASLLTVWVGLQLSRWVGFEWDIFPTGSYANLLDHPLAWADHLVMPGLTLGLPVAAIYGRVLRALVDDVRAAEDDDERRAAKRTGAIIFLKGLLRDIGFLIGAAALVENVFDLPGLGRTIVIAVQSGDGPFVEGCLIVGTLVAVTVALLGNLAGGAVSRRWRSGS